MSGIGISVIAAVSCTSSLPVRSTWHAQTRLPLPRPRARLCILSSAARGSFL